MTHQHKVTRPAWRLALALLAVCSGPALAQGIPDRLELHGSLNAAYGRSHELPMFGLPLTGTSDYRVFTLQGRYALTENDQIVAQVFNRRLGTSPYAPALPDVTMQWAYWQHKSGDFTFKVGRNPLPRGLVNEVRYIGTVLPFFRPSNELTGEAFDAIDGAVVSYRHEIGHGVELEQHGFAGGSENRATANTTTGTELRIARTENMFGGQTYLTLPVAGIRFGAYAARYNFVQPTSRGYRTNTIFSAEATPVDRVKLVTEQGRYTGHGPANDNRNGYFEGTFRLTHRLSIAGQHAYLSRMLFFANPDMNFVYPETRSNGASAIVHLTANSVLKLENHWRDGWSFDTPTNPIAAQTATDVTLSPMRYGRYFLVSVAASF
jgi:hypothetical protein